MINNDDGEVLRLEVPSPETLQQRVMHSAPSYGKPIEVGHYSVNGKGELVHDRSELVPLPLSLSDLSVHDHLALIVESLPTEG